MSNSLKEITLIFSENPIARAYLYLLIKKKLFSNKVIYLNNKIIFNKFFLKLRYYSTFKKTLGYLKSKEILILIKEIEEYFNLEKDFLIDMYTFENIYKLKNIEFAKHQDINNELNIEYFKSLKEKNFLNTSNRIFKSILDTNKNFYHIHPGYMYKVRGADGTLNSIKYYDNVGATFFLMDNKIDNGKIIERFERNFKKIYFPDSLKLKTHDLYNIWFSFFDPAIRVFLLNKMLSDDISLVDYKNINLSKEENNYYKFINKSELRDLFINKIFFD
tara:strand:+ start:4055 stop:4879 length:825 start_codon:yes stop_codon:yes gene_type:complete